jgi:PKD repeat protein
MRRERRAVVAGLGVTLVASLLAALWGCTLFNQAPTAAITAAPLAGESPLVVTFDAVGSVDPDGEIVAVQWDFGDGATSSEAIAHHTFLALAETKVFTVTLRVTDEGGASDSATQSIEVRPPATGGGGTGSPVARITVDRIIGRTPLAVTFSAEGSEPGTGSITQVRWDFGDETGATGYTASHTYAPGATQVFRATVFVANSAGLLDAEQVEIIVIVPEGMTDGEGPVAELAVSDPLLLYGSPTPATVPTLYEISFDPRGSSANAGHSIAYFAWEFGDGERRVETSDMGVTHVYRLPSPSRTFVARLLVYDDQGLEGSQIVNLTLTQPTD